MRAFLTQRQYKTLANLSPRQLYAKSKVKRLGLEGTGLGHGQQFDNIEHPYASIDGPVNCEVSGGTGPGCQRNGSTRHQLWHAHENDTP